MIMIKRYRNTKLLALLTLLSMNAVSDESNTTNDEGSFSIGVGLGYSSLNLNETNIINSYPELNTGAQFDDTATSFNLSGAWIMDNHFALEFDLVLAGDITATDSGREYKLFDVTTLATTVAYNYRISESTKIFGRFGVHLWDISAGESYGYYSHSLSSAVDLTYGLGVDFSLFGNRSRQLRMQWNHYEYDGVLINDNDILSVNLVFVFGL
jgi:hypothetical protein